MNEYESIKSKVLKLQVLAERGDGGEAANAKRLLDGILERHGFTLEKILSEKEEKKNINLRQIMNMKKDCFFSVTSKF